MSGPSDSAKEHAADASALNEFAAANDPPYHVTYKRGENRAEAEIHAIQTGFGNGRAMLQFENGHYVTVDVETELERAEVSR